MRHENLFLTIIKCLKRIKSFLQKLKVENKNYALFNYVNELNNKVEQLQEQIDQVKIYSI